MSAQDRIKCTYEDCYERFDTEKHMKSHKKHSDEHYYCHKCDEDFDDFEAFAFHKILVPDKHNKACRVCGDEFKSDSGLKRHIELNHKVDQRLACIGCGESFYRACLFIEHLEFGHCHVISASQFQGHIVHKHLITEYLKSDEALTRLRQKQAKYDAAIDCDEDEGGIDLGEQAFDDEELQEIDYKAIQPDTPPDTPITTGPYPPLPSQMGIVSTTNLDIASKFGGISLLDDSEASTVLDSPVFSAVATTFPTEAYGSISTSQVPTTRGSTTASSNRQPKVWGSRDGKSASSVLFPDAKPTPASEEFSIAAYDEQRESEHGLNMMKSHFWDPISNDFEQERWFDTLIGRYYCPFVCEQVFLSAGDQRSHIMEDHRITRMKCPMCLKYFKSATALMAHCESRGARCEINKAEDFNIFLDRLSGGFLGVEEKTRPDHLNNPSRLLPNQDTGRLERYKPTVASYLQYEVTTPPDWKEPDRSTLVGGVALQRRVRW